MARLPNPGSDAGTWGEVLNDYLSQSHAGDGSLKPDSVGSSQIQDNAITASAIAPNAVTSSQLADNAVTSATIADGSITEAQLDTDVQSKLSTIVTGIVDGSITTSKLADGAVDTTKIASATISDTNIATSAAISQSKILNLPTDLAGKYVKPSTGIPKNDLIAAVQTTLGKADTAIQTVNSKTGSFINLASTDLTDVAITSPSGGQVLTYDTASSKWKNIVVPTAPVTSVASRTGDIVLSKSDVGLSNLDNTADINKPISSAVQSALDLKPNMSSLSSVATSGSYVDLSNKPLIPVTSVATRTGDVILSKTDVGLTNVDNTSDVSKPISTAVQAALNLKATTTSLSAVATSGSYADLLNKPSAVTIPVTSVATRTGDVVLTKTDVGLANVDNTSDVNKPISTAVQNALSLKAATSSLSTVATTGSYADLSNKPTIPTVPVTSVASRTGDIVLTGADIGLGNVNNTSDANKPISTAMQTALNLKATTSTLSAVATSGSYADLLNKPAAVTIPVTSVATRTGDIVLTSSDVGLGNVNNTSDANKPISTATQTALNSKATTSALSTVATSGSYADLTNKPTIPTVPVTSVAGRTGDVVLTSADVGLANVSNTSDANKPVSTATQTALNLKADANTVGTKLLLISSASALPAGTPAGVVVVVQS